MYNHTPDTIWYANISLLRAVVPVIAHVQHVVAINYMYYLSGRITVYTVHISGFHFADVFNIQYNVQL